MFLVKFRPIEALIDGDIFVLALIGLIKPRCFLGELAADGSDVKVCDVFGGHDVSGPFFC